MSYDISIIATITTNVYSDNHTSNTAGMWAEAGCQIRDLRGMKSSEAAPIIAKAIKEMRRDPAKYAAMEPDNRWSTYDTALKFLVDLHAGCVQYPDGEIEVNW